MNMAAACGFSCHVTSGSNFSFVERPNFVIRRSVRLSNCELVPGAALKCQAKLRLQDGEKGTRQRAAKQEQRRQALENYRSRFARALEAELAEEMLAMKERLKNWPKNRLQDEGMALFDLSVRLDGSLYRDTVLQFYMTQGNGILPVHHQFSQGDVIAISRRNPLDEEDSVIEGVVMERARRFLRVAVPSRQSGDIDQRLKWRLDLYANQVAFERCMWATKVFASPSIRQGSTPSTRAGMSTVNQARVTNDATPAESLANIGEGLLSFRDMIIAAEAGRSINDSTSKVKERNQPATAVSLPADMLSIVNSPPSRVGGQNLGTHKGLVSAFLQHMDLNSSQKTAIQKAMSRRMTLWQGPPGTGKTRTLVHFIKGFCKKGHGKVLACADSNVAVDNIIEGLLEQGLRVVRVGQPVKVKEELRGVTIAAQVAAHPIMRRAQQLREDAILKRKQVRQINNDRMRKVSAMEATSLWDKATQLEKQALKSVLDGVDVVCATCVGAGDPVLDGRQFQACVLDEASQATEPASLIPILRSGADTIVLVGDPAQLPPTVLSNDGIEAGLSKSLFEHLQECGMEPLLLDTQYRMHPVLATWPSAMFYGSSLLSHVKPSERLAPRSMEWPNKDKPLVFIECLTGMEETTALGNSWFNKAEALEVVRIVKLLISGSNADVRCLDIGVISPYGAQVRLLQDLFMREESAENGTFADLEVKTVDGFQGREKEVIVISTVRANSEGRLGFLTDPRRMNVALTRAKRGLVVIGNSETLQISFHWGKWLEMVWKQKLVHELGGERSP